MWTFNSIWHLVVSTFSIANLIGIAAVLAAVFSQNIIVKFAIPDLRKWAIVVAVCAFGYSAVYTKGYSDGLSVKQTEWNKALAKQIGVGSKARSDAERTVDDAAPGGLSNDRYDRDNP